jgi:hypothetical protein
MPPTCGLCGKYGDCVAHVSKEQENGAHMRTVCGKSLCLIVPTSLQRTV